jgi:hypothetical protein
LEKQSTEGWIVARNKAKNELEQHIAGELKGVRSGCSEGWEQSVSV